MSDRRLGLVLVIGGECSGKTTLCEALASALPAQLVPETLRTWCEDRGRTPHPGEQRSIVAGQLLAERAARRLALFRGRRWIVCDGAPLLTAAYSSEYFGDDSLLETGLRHARRANAILLTDPGIAWRSDGFLRDGPEQRAAVHARLLDSLARAGLPHQRIHGNLTQRLQTCLALLR